MDRSTERSGGEDKSLLARFVDFFTADDEFKHPPVPDECPHCELPVETVQLTHHGKVVSRRWVCQWCGNAPDEEPSHTAAEAWENFAQHKQRINRICKEHRGRFN